jgi:hypothetical protein
VNYAGFGRRDSLPSSRQNVIALRAITLANILAGSLEKFHFSIDETQIHFTSKSRLFPLPKVV